MKTLTRKPHSGAADDYLELIRAFPLRSLRTKDDHTVAVKILGRL